APEDRHESSDDCRNRHELRTKAQKSTFYHGFTKVGASQYSALKPLSLDGFFQINHHHHGRLHRSSKQRDKTYPNGDREVVMKQPQKVETSGKSKRNGQQDVCRFEKRFIRQVKKDIDDADHDRYDNLQALLCSNLVLILPAPVVVIAGRQVHTSFDGLIGVGNYTARIPTACIEQNRDLQ